MKYSRTAHFLKKGKGRRVAPVETDRTPRVGAFFFSGKQGAEETNFSSLLADDLSDVLVFCDSSVFDTETEPQLFDSLLNRRGKSVLIPRVVEELEPWLRGHRDLLITRAIEEQHQAFEFFSGDGLGPDAVCADYYVNLLGARKKVLTGGRDLAAEVGPLNLQTVRASVQRAVGDRGYILARKGDEAAGRERFTDELLVYTAVVAAVSTGQRVFLLTKDEDILEQFLLE